MTRSPFRHLRHCRALFALALCAWLALASAVWAQQTDCCASMDSVAGMVGMSHGTSGHHHDAGQTDTVMPDNCCSHAALYAPVIAATKLPQAAPAQAIWRVYRQVPPQPADEPPLRPPLV